MAMEKVNIALFKKSIGVNLLHSYPEPFNYLKVLQDFRMFH